MTTSVLFCLSAFQTASPQYVLVHVAAPPLVQDFALLFVELHGDPVSPFLQLVEVSLDGSVTLW